MMTSSNPAISRSRFMQSRATADGIMTVEGTANKGVLLLGLVLLTALWSWQQSIAMLGVGAYSESNSSFPMILMGAGIAGFVIALITIFKNKAAPYTAPLYALCEGVVLGGISGAMEVRYPGIALQAMLGTLGTFFVMLFAYRSKAIRVTPAFQKGLMAAMGGIMIVYLLTMVMHLFGKNVPFIYESGPIGIAFSLFVVGIAAFSLILDFESVVEGARMGAPKYMEWYAAFGLLVTLVWLYLEILRLLSKLRDRR